MHNLKFKLIISNLFGEMKILIYFTIFLFICLIKSMQGQSCSSDNDCNNGICRSGACLCNAGYVTFGSNGTCNYQQKNKITAFLLSFLIGTTGADW